MHSRNIKEWKNSLRLYSRAFRESMDPAEKEAADGAILRRLLSLREYRKAEWIYTYVSKPIEVNTLALIENALRHGKHVAVPRCVPGTREMEFYEIRSPFRTESRHIRRFGTCSGKRPACAGRKREGCALCRVSALTWKGTGWDMEKGITIDFFPAFQVSRQVSATKAA